MLTVKTPGRDSGAEMGLEFGNLKMGWGRAVRSLRRGESGLSRWPLATQFVRHFRIHGGSGRRPWSDD